VIIGEQPEDVEIIDATGNSSCLVALISTHSHAIYLLWHRGKTILLLGTARRLAAAPTTIPLTSSSPTLSSRFFKMPII